MVSRTSDVASAGLKARDRECIACRSRSRRPGHTETRTLSVAVIARIDYAVSEHVRLVVNTSIWPSKLSMMLVRVRHALLVTSWPLAFAPPPCHHRHRARPFHLPSPRSWLFRPREAKARMGSPARTCRSCRRQRTHHSRFVICGTVALVTLGSSSIPCLMIPRLLVRPPDRYPVVFCSRGSAPLPGQQAWMKAWPWLPGRIDRAIVW